ncbi:hypothetical protein [Tenacibaculum sp. M341]|uniref:hypothetical protein n=1 Tax=Tenacibaculum sp. M341 TaxID=2530339 RepID=UPI001404E218|nr:hypothetical protein [Tenacibaculum sp. M341]
MSLLFSWLRVFISGDIEMKLLFIIQLHFKIVSSISLIIMFESNFKIGAQKNTT